MTDQTQTQTQTNVKIGNLHSPRFADVSTRGCRTQAQYDAVMEWHKTHPSAWWCSDPFEADGHNYRCTFCHAYFDTKGNYQNIYITPTGRVRSLLSVDRAFRAECTAVVAKHGAFKP